MSFDTEEGASGQVPVMAYAVAVPLLAAFALAFVDRASPDWSLPWWAYLTGFSIAVSLVGGLIAAAGNLGERAHGRDESRR